MRALLYIIPIVLLFVVICCGATDVWVQDTVKVVDTTPKSWVDHVTGGSTIVLAVFTIVLAGATGYYAWQTRRHVDVSRDLLASNKELIELDKAQNSIIKAQLLSNLRYGIKDRDGYFDLAILDDETMDKDDLNLFIAVEIKYNKSFNLMSVRGDILNL